MECRQLCSKKYKRICVTIQSIYLRDNYISEKKEME